MPKLRESPKTHMDRAFMAALRHGQELRGEKDIDTAKILPKSKSSYYHHLHNMDLFTREELRILIPRYFNDRQLCEAFGVEYCGSTPALNRPQRAVEENPTKQQFKCQTIAQFKIMSWLSAQGLSQDDIDRVELLEGDRIQIFNPAGQDMVVVWKGDHAEIEAEP